MLPGHAYHLSGSRILPHHSPCGLLKLMKFTLWRISRRRFSVKRRNSKVSGSIGLRLLAQVNTPQPFNGSLKLCPCLSPLPFSLFFLPFISDYFSMILCCISGIKILFFLLLQFTPEMHALCILPLDPWS